MITEPIWRCPYCRGRLQRRSERLACASCFRHYEFVGDIPDLRVEGRSWVDQAQDRAEARLLLAEGSRLSCRELVKWVFSRRVGWDMKRIEQRTEQVMAAPDRLRTELQDWLHPIVDGHGYFLDVGCGNGTLLAAASSFGRQGVGIDASMLWLQVAARMIQAHGGRPILAAALAEALPIADRTVDGVVSLDVIEHVGDPVPYLCELDRVAKPGAFLAIATPNRFSLAAEPHVGLLGVGFLPRSLQKLYVLWRRGESYEFTHLLSPAKAAKLVAKYTAFRFRTIVPPLPTQEIARFSVRRRLLARLYNRLLAAGSDRLLRPICPFFRIVGIHRGEPR